MTWRRAARRGYCMAAAGGLLILSATALRAQNASPAQPATAAPPMPVSPAPGAEGVSLAYKYKIGSIQRFRTDTTGNLSVSLEGAQSAAGIPPAIPLGMKLSNQYTERVAGTHQGTGTLSLQVETMNMLYEAFGKRAQVRYANGRSTATLDGRPAPQNTVSAGAARLAQLRKPVAIRRDPRGLVTLVSAAAAGQTQPGAGELFGAGNVSILVLPDHPVQVGDSWESTQRVQPNIPVPNGGASAIPVLEIKLTHTLKSLGTKNGHVFALIDTTGSGSSPEGAPGGSINESFAGTTRFDVARGAVTSGTYNMEIAMKLPAATVGFIPPPSASGAAPATPPSMRIDGTMAMVLMEMPTNSMRAAAAKSAARRRRR